MYAAYERGAFGNKLRTWKNIKEICDDNYGGTMTARSIGVGGGGLTSYRIASLGDALNLVLKWRDQGIPPEKVRFNESAPDHLLILQGEVSRLWDGLHLRWSDTPSLKMREAMEHDCHHSRGLKAKLLLEGKLTPSSLEDLYALMEQHPTSVIEFSAYSKPVGHLPGRNAVIWETRDY
jgi:hypothetical protein